MSKPFRGMPQPQMNHLRPDIVLIEYSDPGAEEFRLSTNTYALLNSGRMLLVDTNTSSLLPFVRQLSDDGFSPSALVITHRHVVGLGDALGDLKSEFKIPLLLHPIDAGHRQALNSGLSFENPVGHQAYMSPMSGSTTPNITQREQPELSADLVDSIKCEAPIRNNADLSAFCQDGRK